MYNPHQIRFIQSLSIAESRLIEEHLNKSRSLIDGSKEDGMELKLFKFLISHKKETVTDEMIIAETGTKRVSDLKSNLFSKVLESLTFDKHITNSTVFNEYDTNILILKKKLLVFKISSRSVTHGKTEALNLLLEEIIEGAKEFEAYDTLVEALISKKYFTGIRLGQKEFEALNNEVEFYDYCYKSLFSATDGYYRLILNTEFVKQLSEKEVKKHISESILLMGANYKKTKSQQINYYMHIMQIALCEKEKQYSEAIDYCNKLMSIIQKNKSIYRPERVGFVHDHLSLFKTHLLNYKEAAKDAKSAQKFYLEESFNYAVSKEQEFYTIFYNGDYVGAHKCLIDLQNHHTYGTGPFKKSKIVYYQACILFMDKKFSQALRMLTESLEIEKDKSRWNISLRILNIMIFIEMNKINEASTSLEALRKHVGRTGKTDEVSERDDMIVRTLREMEKDGFQYDDKNPNMAKLFKQLSETDSKTSWEHYSSELIKFHEWLEAKKK